MIPNIFVGFWCCELDTHARANLTTPTGMTHHRWQCNDDTPIHGSQPGVRLVLERFLALTSQGPVAQKRRRYMRQTECTPTFTRYDTYTQQEENRQEEMTVVTAQAQCLILLLPITECRGCRDATSEVPLPTAVVNLPSCPKADSSWRS